MSSIRFLWLFPILLFVLGCQPKEQHAEVVFTYGSGGTGKGQFKYIEGIAFTQFGNVLVSDAANKNVIVFNAKGEYLTDFGNVSNDHGEVKGKKESPLLEKPEGVAVDSATGSIFVADHVTGFIKKYDADYQWLKTFSSYGKDEGQTIGNEFMTIHPNGQLYVAEAGNNRISRFSLKGEFVALFGSRGTGDGQFDRPMSIKVNSLGHVYVTDQNNHRVQVFDQYGKYMFQFGERGRELGQMRRPTGLAIDDQDNVYVSESSNNRIQKFTSEGKPLYIYGERGQEVGQFGNPHDIAFDTKGLLHVTDTANNRVQVLRVK